MRYMKQFSFFSTLTWKHIFVGVGMLLFFAALLFLYQSGRPRAGTISFEKEYQTTLVDYAGKKVRFAEFKGKPLVVCFWATWSPYAKDELNYVAQLKKEYGDAVHIVAVNRAEPLRDAKSLTDGMSLEGVVLLLDADDLLFKDLGGYAMPELVFINPRSEQVVHQRGPMTLEETRDAIKKII